MREFKFRAWSEPLKKMDYNELNAIGFDGKIHFGNADITGFHNSVMQYTGLKDKNGVEIYEGDILEYTNSFGHRERKNILVVKWSDADSSFLMGGIRTDYAVRGSVVIGNIYENPELIV